MLGERFGCYRLLISIFMITGVILITRPGAFFPPDDSKSYPTNMSINYSNGSGPFVDSKCVWGESSMITNSTLGYVAGVFVPILSAIVSIWTRQCKNIDATILMFWFGVGTFVVAIGKIRLRTVRSIYRVHVVNCNTTQRRFQK